MSPDVKKRKNSQWNQCIHYLWGGNKRDIKGKKSMQSQLVVTANLEVKQKNVC